MSIEQGPSFRANESIGAYVVVAVNGSSTSLEFRIEIADTSTSLGIGIIQDNVSTDGSADVRTLGIGRGQCAASISAGALVSWQTTTGLLVAATTSATTTATRGTIGWALQPGSTDSVISVYVNPTPPGLLGVAL